MFIVSVINTKGGVGKTTLSILIASQLSNGGRDVRLIDLDPEGETSGALAFSKRARARMVIDGPRPPDKGFFPAWDIVGARDSLRSAVEALGDAYAVVVDSKPSSGDEERIATACAELVVVPCVPGPAEAAATARIIERAQRMQSSRGDGYPQVAIAPTRWRKRSKVADRTFEELSGLGVSVLPVVHDRAIFPEAFAQGKIASMGRSAAAIEVQRQIYSALELIKGVL